MEQYDLAITTSNADFIRCDCLDAFDALSADVLCKDHQFVLDLEATEVSTLCACK